MKPASWLCHAWPELGQREVRGKRDNERIVALYRDAGHPNIKHDEVPWCAAFVGAVLKRAGLVTTNSLLARSYLRWGVALDAARFGAIAVLSRGSNPAHGHVGFVVGETKDRLWLLGGNQSDAVTVSVFPKSRLLGFRWPSGVGQDGAENRNSAPVGVRLPDSVLAHILDVEGGYTNDPVDPGGPTNKGITLAVYARWVGVDLTTVTRARLLRELKTISDETVRDIYQARYWVSSQAGDLPPALALMHMDAGVNHGVGTAIRFLQAAVRTDVDGEIGPLTRAAITQQPMLQTLSRYADIRRRRYRKLKHFWRFGRGWLARVDKTLNRAIALHEQRSPTKPTLTKTDEINKTENDMTLQNGVNETDEKWWGQSLTIWGAIVTAAATVLPAIGPILGWDITADMVRLAGEQLVQVVQALAGLVGTTMTIYGRARASKTLVHKPFTIQF
ncbi:MAG: TIGR02594 family protein [Hyphomicrobiaceae bacterium]